MSEISNRLLSRKALDEYLALGAPAVIVVPGQPTCRIIVDPLHGELSLRTLFRGKELDLTEFEYVESRLLTDDSQVWQEVVVTFNDHPHEAYLLLSAIADMVQCDGVAFELAVPSALGTFRELIVRYSSLSVERQLGLYGELLFLEHCMKILPESTRAIDFWKGFMLHEHDFVFPGMCVEVKTTNSEKRRHQISSLEQLQSLPNVPLWLVSVQLTTSVENGGRSLPSLVDEVRICAGSARASLDDSLARAGWRDRDRSLYRETLTLRSVPTAYVVDASFPSLTRTGIMGICPRPEMIIDASYRIDLTSLAPAIPPEPAAGFVQGVNLS